MPYVEGYGTWPFGEEWLWEAMATSYLPLADVLDAHPGRITLSLTLAILAVRAMPVRISAGENRLRMLVTGQGTPHRH
jgi:1,4-alpha-glucan branching enzyme